MKTPFPTILSAGVLLCSTLLSPAQNLFTSGSTGADGALNFTAPPTGRSSIHMVFNPVRQTCMTFGGFDGVTQFPDTPEFDGTSWSPVSPVFSPTARTVYVMTYDTTRNKAVLYGGFDAQAAGAVNDTWEFSDDRWTEVSTAANPGNALFRSLAYDSNRQRTVLFGGDGGSKIDDTWEYDGSNWTLALTNGPPGRSEAAMTFHGTRNVVVLFGGKGNSGMINDTWEYNGTWTQRSPTAKPTPRIRSASTFTLDRIVLFGGDDGVMKNDTWEYTDNIWTLKTPASSPPARRDHGLCYDPVRNRTVLFGGTDGTTFFDDTWEWDGTNWTEIASINKAPVIDMSAKPDGVWNYTSVNIGEDVIVSFDKNDGNTPVTWLTTDNVIIDGTVDVSGEDGTNVTAAATRAAGGPGGFDGGLGGLFFSENQKSGEPGLGPGGGLPGVNDGEDGGDGGFSIAGADPSGGSVYGNIFNAPIIGGSGGGGGAAVVTNLTHGGLGGGGGGALLIASSETITLNGTIDADGGRGAVKTNAGNGGDGSGGAVRLVADRVEGPGTISAGTNGRIRTEGFVVALDQVFTPIQSQAPPYEVDLAGQGVIRIVQVDGAVVRANPKGDINDPDVIFSDTGEVVISMTTENVPPGTPIDVRITSGATVINVVSSAVTGTLANGSASATATVPAGSGTIQAFAEFTN